LIKAPVPPELFGYTIGDPDNSIRFVSHHPSLSSIAMGCSNRTALK
jgi:hypothetical protein